MSTEPRPTPVNGIVITFFSTASAVGKTLVLAPQKTALGDALRALVGRYTNHSSTPAETEAKQQESSWLSRIFS